MKKYGPRCFFCILEGHFKLDCTQFWDALANLKQPRQEEALSGVNASPPRLMNEHESRKKEVSQGTFATKKVYTLPENYGLAPRSALQKAQQELATKEIEQWVMFELENTMLREKLDTLEKTVKTEEKGDT